MQPLTAKVIAVELGENNAHTVRLRFPAATSFVYNALAVQNTDNLALGDTVTFVSVSQEVAQELADLRVELGLAKSALQEYQRRDLEQDMAREEVEVVNA
jgi:hypothetical protein